MTESRPKYISPKGWNESRRQRRDEWKGRDEGTNVVTNGKEKEEVSEVLFIPDNWIKLSLCAEGVRIAFFSFGAILTPSGSQRFTPGQWHTPKTTGTVIHHSATWKHGTRT